ncbi:hypothetical protein GLOTRDRAFT_136703 [Gloeophyllum trabeum ATCC 11539]|uniref:F-box domain-containing protein n=1 Tax=Gloeophyllum trabeum (strain ATCC 11539 / FP-39264 / Madison 617) TaxID=670483 RepID=S7QEK1_GLOTA|nr:uncharacterized protein GLOTRDRAFT_136703 [Gloeophyllum trabeum ATCC 11539]EPQ57862.1 hypothetical protein GLOTRDRAFT_136703 [Gloeophyllum trabeum ATCC 11539]
MIRVRKSLRSRAARHLVEKSDSNRRPVTSHVTAQSLPYELVLLILSYVLAPSQWQTDTTDPRTALPTALEEARWTARQDQATLCLLLSVCKNWYCSAIDLLYRAPVLKNLAQESVLSRTLRAKPELAQLMRSLVLVDYTRYMSRSWAYATRDRARYARKLGALIEACPAADALTLRIPAFEPPLTLRSLHVPARLARLTKMTLIGQDTWFLSPPYFGSPLELPALRELCLLHMQIREDLEWPSMPTLRVLRTSHCAAMGVLIPAKLPSLRELSLTEFGVECISRTSALVREKYAATLERVNIGGLGAAAFSRALDFSAFTALRSLTLVPDTRDGLVVGELPDSLGAAPRVESLTVGCIHRDAMGTRYAEARLAENLVRTVGTMRALRRLVVAGDSRVWEKKERGADVTRIEMLADACASAGVELVSIVVPSVPRETTLLPDVPNGDHLCTLCKKESTLDHLPPHESYRWRKAFNHHCEIRSHGTAYFFSIVELLKDLAQVSTLRRALPANPGLAPLVISAVLMNDTGNHYEYSWFIVGALAIF